MRMRVSFWAVVFVTVCSVGGWAAPVSAPSPDGAVAAVLATQSALKAAKTQASAALKLEDWESDEEFAARRLKFENDSTKPERAAFEAAVAALRAPVFSVPETSVAMKASQDAKSGRVSVTLTSTDPAVPYTGSLAYTPRGAAEAKRWGEAAKAGTLAARIPFKLYRLDNVRGRAAVTSVELGTAAAKGFTVWATVSANGLFDFPWDHRDKAVKGQLLDQVRVDAGRAVKQSFWITRTAITQDQYEQVMGVNPAQFREGFDAAQRPVESVNYFTAAEFCNRLSLMDGLSPVYAGERGNFKVDYTKSGWRMPFKEEYQFAAEGGLKTKGYTFVGGDDYDKIGWYTENSGGTTHPVAAKLPNELGLYDMAGNVYAWLEQPDEHDTSGLFGGGAAAASQPGAGSPEGMQPQIVQGGVTYGFASLQIGIRLVRR